MAFELSPKNQLIPLSVDDLSPRHPLHLLHEVYMRLAAQASGAQLPDLETVIAHCPPALPDFWMLLEPVAADPFIDYAVLKRGSADLPEQHDRKEKIIDQSVAGFQKSGIGQALPFQAPPKEQEHKHRKK